MLSWRDALGKTIDPQIVETVTILNVLGLGTSGSCQGHLNRGSCSPWIDFQPDDVVENESVQDELRRLQIEWFTLIEQGSDRDDPEVTGLQSQAFALVKSLFSEQDHHKVKLLRRRVQRHVNLFYRYCPPDPSLPRLMIETINPIFRLTCEGTDEADDLPRDGRQAYLADSRQVMKEFTEYLMRGWAARGTRGEPRAPHA